MKVSIYSDGSARGNPDGPGGYGVLLRYVDGNGTAHEKEISALRVRFEAASGGSQQGKLCIPAEGWRVCPKSGTERRPQVETRLGKGNASAHSTRTAETLDSVRRGQEPNERGHRSGQKVHRRVDDSPRIRRDVPQTPLPETSPNGTDFEQDRASAPEAVGKRGQKTMKGSIYGHQTWS